MKKIVIILLSCCIGGIFQGCNKYLDKLPDNRIDLSNVDNITPDRISELLATAYPKSDYIPFCEASSDNVGDKGTGMTDNSIYSAFLYMNDQATGYNAPLMYWNSAYGAISIANQALEAINRVPDPERYTQQMGEAYVCRAYAHFMLSVFFCQPYDSTTAANFPGIPYVTVPTTKVFETYDRETLEKTYAKIEHDLNEGLPLLRNAKYAVPAFHFTEAAAHAFAARFYLFKKNYNKVIEHSSQVAPGNGFAALLRPWTTKYYNMGVYELMTYYCSSSEKANLLLIEAPSTWPRYIARHRFGLTSTIVTYVFGNLNSLISDTVARGYFTLGTSTSLYMPKFDEYFVNNSANSSSGIPYNMVPAFSVEEALLNRAEAYLMKDNYSSALADFNTLASARSLKYKPVTVDSCRKFFGISDNKEAVKTAILLLKRAELMQEGVRWFDILRHDIKVVHTYKPSNADAIVDSIPAKDPKRAFELPDNAESFGMPKNNSRKDRQ